MPTVQSIMLSQKPFGFVLNQAPARSKRVDDTHAALVTLGIVSDTVMVNRFDHADAVGSGYGVTEFRSESAAAAELRSLWDWIAANAGLSTKEKTHDQAA
jgi:chromosome partitioning protein